MNERRKGDRRIPPAVAQHLVEERGELLARIADLEADVLQWRANSAENKLIAESLSAELAALKAGQGEAVAHVSEETFSSDGTSDIITRNLPIRTALFIAPPATGVIVPREMLRQWTDILDGAGPAGYGWEDNMSKEIRALLAKGENP